MIELIRNVLISLYQQLNAAVLLACIASVALLYVEEHGIKNSFKVWCKRTRNDKEFRRTIYLMFYIGMILFRTLFCMPEPHWGQAPEIFHKEGVRTIFGPNVERC